MATDGVKILDNDISNDIYSSIIALFDTGIDKDEILKQYPFKRKDYGPDADYYHELFVTAYALAFWELGWFNNEILGELGKVISKGASVSVWTEEHGPSAGRRRQRLLDKLLVKVKSENTRPRKRIDYKQTENAIFEKGDIITYQQETGIYRVIVCVDVSIEKGKIWYTFTPTSCYCETLPTLADIMDSGLYGVRIAASGDKEFLSESQEGVSELWALFPEASAHIEENAPFLIGLHQDFIQHKHLGHSKGKFQRIGTLRLKQQFNKQGSASLSSDFSQFDKGENFYQKLMFHKFPIKKLCEI